MPGRVLTEVLDDTTTLTIGNRLVASYEPEGGHEATAVAADSAVDPQILAHLRALGYLDAHSPGGEGARAAMQFHAGETERAAAAYQELVREHPNDAALRASYAGALGALGRYEESLNQLEQALALDPTNAEAHHNRGVVHEAQGNHELAAREYEKALVFRPDYIPSRSALARLRTGAASGPPTDPSLVLASKLLARARDATLRGNYEGALREIEAAERIAPDFARVPHYRSNIEYLMGNKAGAIAALERALEIEPGNPLYETNLERLEAAPAQTE
jgi:tetratricopeptide (TPR) repeat protein